MANFDDEEVAADEVEEEVPVSEAEVEEEVVPVEEAQVVAGEEVVGGPVRTTEGSLTAAGLGALNVGSMGFADEAAAAMGFPGYAGAEAQAKKDYPGAYQLGQVGAAVPLGLAGGELPAAARYGASAAGGAIYGAGEAPTASEIPGNMAIGAAGGLAGQAGGDLLGWLGRKAAGIGRGAFASTMGVKPSYVEEYLNNPNLVRAARDPEDLAQAVEKGAEALKNRVVGRSQEAMDLLPQDESIPVEPFLGKLQNMAIKYTDEITDQSQGIAAELTRWHDRLAKISQGGGISPQQLKQQIKAIDRVTQYLQSRNEFMEPGNQARLEFRKALDTELKNMYPEYAKAMEPVAEDAQILSIVNDEILGGSEDTVAGRLKRMAQNPALHGGKRRALEIFDNRMQTQLLAENDASVIRRAFEAEGVERGSKRTLAGAGFGGGLGAAMGSGELAGLLTMGGTMAGQALDARGPQYAQSILDKYLTMTRNPMAGAMRKTIKAPLQAPAAGVLGASQMEHGGEAQAATGEFRIPETLKGSQYEKLLEQSKARGESATGATHYMLMKNDPTYRQKYLGATP